MADFSHLDAEGKAKMVNVGAKPITEREARAQAVVRLQEETMARIRDAKLPKGDVIQTARLAGIMAAKRTPELIPLCHQINLVQVDIEAQLDSDRITLIATARAHDRTGVEMEAMTAVMVAALTVYDMCKAVDRGACITDVFLLEKKGGKSGHYQRDESV